MLKCLSNFAFVFLHETNSCYYLAMIYFQLYWHSLVLPLKRSFDSGLSSNTARFHFGGFAVTDFKLQINTTLPFFELSGKNLSAQFFSIFFIVSLCYNTNTEPKDHERKSNLNSRRDHVRISKTRPSLLLLI